MPQHRVAFRAVLAAGKNEYIRSDKWYRSCRQVDPVRGQAMDLDGDLRGWRVLWPLKLMQQHGATS